MAEGPVAESWHASGAVVEATTVPVQAGPEKLVLVKCVALHEAEMETEPPEEPPEPVAVQPSGLPTTIKGVTGGSVALLQRVGGLYERSSAVLAGAKVPGAHE